MSVGTINFLRKLTNLLPTWQWTRDKFFTNFNRISWFGNNTVIIDTEDPITAYNDCPHFQLVIDRKAQMFANGQWLCFDKTDVKFENPIEGDPGIELLKNPNAMQTGEEFLAQYQFYKSLFSNGFIYKLRGSRMAEVPTALWHLPSDLMEIVLTGKIFQQFELNQIIDKYVLRFNEVATDFAVEDVIYKAENFNIDIGKGISKVPSLKLPINNIIAALRTRNIIITNKGIFGFMSSDIKDAAGTISLDGDSRKLIEDQFADDANLYSERAKIKITNTPTKWNSMSFPLKDLLLSEGNEDEFAAILGAYGMDRDLFPSTKGATFENKKQAEILTYNSTIQPEADALAAVMTKQLGADERGKIYVLDYSWLSIMQKDKKMEEEVLKIKAERFAVMLDKGVISRQAFADAMDVKLTGEEPSTGSGHEDEDD